MGIYPNRIAPNNSNPTDQAVLTLQRRPKVIRVKEAREFRIQVDNMHIALATVANNSLGEIARLIRLDINPQSSVYL
jgi:hypothetical protein